MSYKPIEPPAEMGLNTFEVKNVVNERNKYLLHCKVKGWKPSTIGFSGFLLLLGKGYYKTL